MLALFCMCANERIVIAVKRKKVLSVRIANSTGILVCAIILQYVLQYTRIDEFVLLRRI